ncbi:hypothetical protein [Dyadobacter luticola]|uniref:Uncharacterized protein n=1 Tax=Dyadobacter luticola TaxID=1979387 RepID=A0A5R9KYV9_9BACT|nr:hypothetical protein [Dyadobacter luticola]TLV01277.1 hypothetical protein FEN17_17705 [Dyadobacter luticola]
MSRSNKNPRKRRSNGPPDPFDPNQFRKVLQNLVANPSTLNVERIRYIRWWFLHSAMVTFCMSKRMLELPRKLLNPNKPELEMILGMIISSHRLYENGKQLVHDYQVLQEANIAVAEIEDFKQAYQKLLESIHYLESVYAISPDLLGINDFLRKN